MTTTKPDRRQDPYYLFLAVVGVAFAWSAIRPNDYGVWIFELSLGLVGTIFLIATRPLFRMSGLAYGLAAIHFVILACGAKFTYAEMPLFNWLRDTLHLARNDFDRVGHLAQGFIPAIFVREFLRRYGGLRPGGLTNFLAVCVCLAFSASYEILEWWIAAIFYPQSGTEWLGMQGDPWDTQEDMLMAAIGATVSMLTLPRLHERSMAALGLRLSGTET